VLALTPSTTTPSSSNAGVVSEPKAARCLAGRWFPDLREHCERYARVDAAWRAHVAAGEDVGEPVLVRIAVLESAFDVVRAVVSSSPDLARDLTRRTPPDPNTDACALVEWQLLNATALDALGELESTARLLSEAHARATNTGDAALSLMALVARGRVLVRLGDETNASAILLEGVALARSLDARRQEAKMLGNLGFLHGERDGRPYEAYTRRALEIGRELGDERLIVHSLCNLGGALAQQGRFEEARACYDEGLPRAEALEWAESVALFRAGLGGVEAGMGEVDRGLALYRESSAYFASVGDTFQVARQRLIVGRHLVRAGRLAEAKGALEECVWMCDSDRFRVLAWQAFELLSTLHERLGDHEVALASLRRSTKIHEELLEARATERLRLLELHVQAERASREIVLERERTAALTAALEEQQRLRAALEAIARTDSLTGLSNRRHITEVLTHEMAYVRRRWRPLTVLLVDVDHFKSVNDHHGHAAGDRVLVEVAARLSQDLREHDWVGRWGGEEFCVVLIDTAPEPGAVVAERLLERLRGTPIEVPSGALCVTASCGAATLRRDETLDQLLHRVDDALYAAKRAGRDRVEFAR
jgi:diguanylate cyclase (GGDEF)-like protein